MSSAKLQRTAAALGLTVLDKNTIYGMADGWPVSIFRRTMSLSTDRTVDGKSLRIAVPQIRRVLCKSGIISVTFRRLTAQGVHGVIAFLKESGAAPSARCPICGQEDCDVLASIGSVYRKTHADCIDKLWDNPLGRKDSVDNGSVLHGISGAFLAMLAIVVPTVVFQLHEAQLMIEGSVFLRPVFAEILIVLSYCHLLPLAVWLGYGLAGGKKHPLIRFPVAISTSIIGQYLCLAAEMTHQFIQYTGSELWKIHMSIPEFEIPSAFGSYPRFLSLIGIWWWEEGRSALFSLLITWSVFIVLYAAVKLLFKVGRSAPIDTARRSLVRIHPELK